MQEVFEKIKERLEKERKEITKWDSDKHYIYIEGADWMGAKSIEIVDQVAKEFADDTNVGTNIVGELKKFLKERKDYNSEQADIWRGNAYTNAHAREMKDLYMDRANTFGRMLSEIKVLEEEYGNDGWITCSKDMPKENEDVLITTKTTGKVYKGTYTKRYGFSMREGLMCDSGFISASEVIAWQPLPEPYKEKK